MKNVVYMIIGGFIGVLLLLIICYLWKIEQNQETIIGLMQEETSIKIEQ